MRNQMLITSLNEEILEQLNKDLSTVEKADEVVLKYNIVRDKFTALMAENAKREQDLVGLKKENKKIRKNFTQLIDKFQAYVND